MKFIHFFLFSILVTVAYGQALKLLFDSLSDPFFYLKPQKVAILPENERLNKSSCKCRLGISKRIVGGEASETIPWQAVFVRSNETGSVFCGATIVNNYYAITTAHCTNKKIPSDISIVVGINNLEDQNVNNTYEVEKIFQGSYKSVSVPGDIAIVKLSRAIKFVPGKIEPACINLNVFKRYPNGLMATGFGTTSPSYKLDNGTFVQGETSKINKKAYFREQILGCRRDLICINSYNRDSACNGDSGGPLMDFTDEAITTVEGGASFVRGTRKRGFSFRDDRIYVCTGFAAYSRFYYYSNWIKSIIGEEYCDEPIFV